MSMTANEIAAALRAAADASADKWADLYELNGDDPRFLTDSGRAAQVERLMRMAADLLDPMVPKKRKNRATEQAVRLFADEHNRGQSMDQIALDLGYTVRHCWRLRRMATVAGLLRKT